jgi:hypothetical protein
MNSKTASKKSVLTLATMLSAIMLAASSMPSLVPTTAFAQQEGSADDLLKQLNLGSNNQKHIRENEGGDNSVIVDPIVQASVQPAININVNTHVITDKEDCEEASDSVDQANELSAGQEGRSDGNVGEGSLYVSPKVQQSTQFALNLNVDTDVILAEGCIPRDNTSQANELSADQNAGGNIDEGKGSTIITPTIQNADQIERNQNVNNDVIQPVPFLQ